MTGRQRKPALVLLWSFLTLGVYWIVWLWRAFGEVSQAFQLPLKRAAVFASAAMWAAGLGFSFQSIVQSIVEPLGSIPPHKSANAAIGLFLSSLGWFAQLWYLENAVRVLGRATSIAGTQGPPPRWLLWLFSSALGLSAVFSAAVGPVFLFLIVAGGALLGLVWFVRTQRCINQLWARRGTGGA